MDKQAESYYTEAEVIIEEAIGILTSYGLDLVGAVLILIIGLWFSKKAAAMTARSLAKSKHIDDTLVSFFSSIVKYLIIVFTVIAVLGQFGVQTASLLTVLGAAGLAIGLALQGTLSNVAAGVMLLVFRPFKVGEYVEAGGKAGTIKELNLFTTVMATPDNIRITVPNSSIWGSSVSNYSVNPTRRVDLVMGIAYEDDIDKAMESIKAVLAEESRIHADPEPFIAVSELGDSSVNFAIRVWVDNGDYWPVKFALTKAMKQRFDSDGINIPYPSRTVYNVSES